jgi:hypothetical protein
MLIYKFRITLEENDNYVRDIEIKPSQTFEDFHNAILDCSALTVGEMASFFMCDIKWRKHQEITLVKTEEDNRRRPVSDKPAVKLMSETKLSQCIESPNEQLIYIYDFQKVHTFYIELFKIYDSKEEAAFPRCTKRVSDVPKVLKHIPGPEVGSIAEEEDEDVVDEFEVEFDDEQIGDDDSLMLGDFLEESASNEVS